MVKKLCLKCCLCTANVVKASDMSVAVNNIKPQEDTYKSLKLIIIVANIFGLLPVNGVTSNSVKNLNFRWICPKTMYTFILIIIAFSEIVCSIIGIFQNSVSFTELSM